MGYLRATVHNLLRLGLSEVDPDRETAGAVFYPRIGSVARAIVGYAAPIAASS
jgi:hypothetical protein